VDKTEKSSQQKREKEKARYEAAAAIFFYGGLLFSSFPIAFFVWFFIRLLNDGDTFLYQNLVWLLGSGVAILICVNMIRAGLSFYTGRQYYGSVALSYLSVGFLLLIMALFPVFSNGANYSLGQLAATPILLIFGLGMIKKGGHLLLSLRVKTTPKQGIQLKSVASNPIFAPIAQINKVANLLPQPMNTSQQSSYILWDKLLLVVKVIASYALAIGFTLLILSLFWLLWSPL